MTPALMLIEILDILLTVVRWIIIIQAIMSWLLAFNVINRSSDFVTTLWMTLERLTEPLYRPIRKIMPDFGALDLTPMVALIIVIILQSVILPRIAMSLIGL